MLQVNSCVEVWNSYIRGRYGVTVEKNFCLRGPKRKTWLGNPPVFHNYSGIEKFLWVREEGVSRFSSANFLSHGAEKVRRRFFVFQKCSVGEASVGYRGMKSLSKLSVGGCRQNSQGKFSGMDKKSRMRHGDYPVFPSIFSISQYKKVSWITHHWFKKLRVFKKFMRKKWISLFFIEVF